MCRANGDMYWIHGTDTLRPAEERPTSEISEPIRINLPGKITPAQFPKPNEKSAAANVGAIARDLLSRLGSPGLIVCPRKVDTRLLARELLAGREEVEDDEVAGIAASILERYPYLDFLVECLKRGVSYHNASLPFDVRRDIEKLTREVCCRWFALQLRSLKAQIFRSGGPLSLTGLLACAIPGRI